MSFYLSTYRQALVRFHPCLQASLLKQLPGFKLGLSRAWLEEAGGCRRSPGRVMLALGRGKVVHSARPRLRPASPTAPLSMQRLVQLSRMGYLHRKTCFKRILTQLGIRCLFSNFPENNQDGKRHTQGLKHLAS